MLKQVFAVSLLVAAVFAETAYFKIKDYTSNEFIIKINRDAQIAHARELISGATEEKPHVYGRIRKSQADYNPKWSYYFDPDQVDFFDHAIEVCDASFSYTEEYLDEACGAFLPGCFFCPWTSKVVEEVKF